MGFNWPGKKKLEDAHGEIPKKATPEGAVDGMEADNVVSMPESGSILVRDSLGNVVGTAGSPAEARAKHIQDAIDAREAA